MDWSKALENVSDGVLALDSEWRITYANGRAERLFRRRRAELQERSWWELFPYLLETPAEADLRAGMGATLAQRFKIFHPPLYAWHEVLTVPSDGGLLVILRDVTDATRMQEREAVRSAIREVFDQAPIAISITRGPEHRVEIQNAMSRQLVGGRDLEGLTIRSALPEIEGQGILELLDQVYTSGQPYHGTEIPVRYDRLGDGAMYDGCFNVTYQPLLDSTGHVTGVLGLSVEVSGLVAERNHVRRQAAVQSAVLTQLAEGLIITAANGDITFVNDVARRLHGTGKLDVQASEYANVYGLLTEEGEPFSPEQLPLARAALHDETVSGARWKIARPDGSVIRVEGSAQPVFLEDGTKVAAVLTLREIPG